MRVGNKNEGYTILEVMIFVTISSFIFVVTAGMLNGKQSAVAFKQSMNTIDSQVKAIINDVNNGYYPSLKTFTCSADAGGGSPVFSSPSVEQGANSGCVFMGKVIQFAPKNADGSANESGYSVYTVAGRQFAGDPKQFTPPTSFALSKPRAAIDSSISLDLTQRPTLQQGMRFTRARDLNLNKDLGAVGFFSSGGGYDSSGTSLESGNQSLIVVPYDDIPLNSPEATVTTAIPNGVVDRNPKILICFDNNNDWYGKLTIGSDSVDNQGQRLATTVSVSKTRDATQC